MRFKHNMKWILFIIIIVILLILVILMSIYLNIRNDERIQQENFEGVENDFENRDLEFSIWIPYWDIENSIDEVVRYRDNIDEIISFAAIYNYPNDEILVLEELDNTIKAVKNEKLSDMENFISITNDLKLSDGTYLSKDVDLLKRLLSTEESRTKRIEEIIKIAENYKVDGIEIDYEQMHKDKEIWPMYKSFIEELYPICVEKGLELRVVLGWKVVDYINLPEGPEYIIMCYNLFGPHNKVEAGPKADIKFLSDAYEKNKKLPGNIQIALANGGFSWSDDEEVKSLTQNAAVELQKKYNIEPKRDKKSGALHFKYKDKNNSYEVWYADSKTLRLWVELGLEYGYNSFAIWRMGGDLVDDLTIVFEGEG